MGMRRDTGSGVGKGVLLAFALAFAGVAQATVVVGEAPPDYLGKTPKGEEIRISDHRGKVMVVSFWASWCPHCRKQFPALDFLQQKVDPAHMRVVIVNFKEDTQTYRAVLRQARDSSVTWTHDRTGAVSDAYGVSSVPNTFIIDKGGRVANIRRGYSEESFPRWIDVLNGLLAAPAPAEALPQQAPSPDAPPAPEDGAADEAVAAASGR